MYVYKNTPITRLFIQLLFDRVEDGGEQGRICCEYLPAPVPFRDLGQMLLSLDKLCDDLDFPQAWEERRRLRTDVRTKAPAPAARTDLRDIQVHGAGWLLPVQVLTRQHASIQGRILIEGSDICFRSALELMGLIRDAMEEKHAARLVRRGRRQRVLEG